MWYCAHAIMYLRRLEGEQREYVVWENMYLIEAGTDDEALRKAEARAREVEGGPERGLQLGDGTPAEWVFAGIRKLIACQDEDRRPNDGTELTYSEYKLPSMEDVRLLARGAAVGLEYLD